MLTIRTISGEGGTEQLDYILRNPRSLLYANPRFIELVAKHLDARAAWIEARRDGAIAGVLPFLAKDGTLGPVFNSMAFYGSNGGVIQHIHDEEAKLGLVAAFYQEANSASACSATLITNPLEQDSEFYEAATEYTFRDERIGQITHFPEIEHVDDLMAHFQDPRPRNIRRALKQGIVVEKSRGEEALDFLYWTHKANILAAGGLPKSKAFFDAIRSTMHDEDWAVFTARLGQRLIAAVLLFYCNRTVEYFTPVIVEKYRITQAPALVIYKAMQDAMQSGYSNWNWGGTWLTQTGVYDFKKRWATSEYRYYYYTRVYNPALMSCKSDYLLGHYPGFFVLPFRNLLQEKEGSHA